MVLTTQQKQTLKADIAANSDVNTFPSNDDGNTAIADLYNLPSVPAFVVWRALVKNTEIGSAFDLGELANKTTADSNRLLVMAAYSSSVNPALQSTRDGFDNIFSGANGPLTRANLAALWKRSALRVEKLFATGTGSTASPATLVLEGKLTLDNIRDARNS